MNKLYIICVDDQREVLASIVRDLSPLAAWTIVEECESAEEARTLLNELDAEDARPALIICDHIMPGANGVDFLAELAKDMRFTLLKKILLTGQATHKDTIDAINKARVDHYFEKPWQPEPLLQTCRRLLSEYLFDTGAYAREFSPHVDPQVLIARLRGQE